MQYFSNLSVQNFKSRIKNIKNGLNPYPFSPDHAKKGRYLNPCARSKNFNLILLFIVRFKFKLTTLFYRFYLYF